MPGCSRGIPRSEKKKLPLNKKQRKEKKDCKDVYKRYAKAMRKASTRKGDIGQLQ